MKDFYNPQTRRLEGNAAILATLLRSGSEGVEVGIRVLLNSKLTHPSNKLKRFVKQTDWLQIIEGQGDFGLDSVDQTKIVLAVQYALVTTDAAEWA